jgi:hypothetical protein
VLIEGSDESLSLTPLRAIEFNHPNMEEIQ